MNIAETIKILLVKRGGLSNAALARKLNTSPQNFYGKMSRNNFSVKELEKIASVLNCELKIEFLDKNTGESLT